MNVFCFFNHKIKGSSIFWYILRTVTKLLWYLFQKKKGGKGPVLSMGKAGNSSNQRLDPLPNSPLHDGSLNRTKPLPQPNFTKKFVK